MECGDGVGDPVLLRTNMKAASISPPSYPSAAHHIVAGNAQLAEPAAAHLEILGIDANHWANGVFLPYLEWGSGAYHRGLHTNAYYEAVNEIVLQARTKQEAIEALRYIADRLMNNMFPY